MAKWQQFTVKGQANLGQLLLTVGYHTPDPAVLETVWNLPENVTNRNDASRNKYDLRDGETVLVPLPQVTPVAVAPGADGLSRVTSLRATLLNAPDSSFRDRLLVFGGLLLQDHSPADAYRSSFSPLLLTQESQVELVYALVTARFGIDTANTFVKFLFDSKLIAPVLEPNVSDADPPAAPTDDPQKAALVWATYPGELSAYINFFLRGEYVQRTAKLVKPEWVRMSDAELTAELKSKMTQEEVEAIYLPLSAKRQIIKNRIRGYGYVRAIVIAMIWARDDISKGDWEAVAAKGAALVGGTWLFNMTVYARDTTPAEIMSLNQGNYGKWLRGTGRTNRYFNRFVRGPWMMALSAITDNSPDAQEPLLPRTDTEAQRIQKVRLELGIPAAAYVDAHGHAKKKSYLEVDAQDIGHSGAEFDQETDEILWWLGVDITYHFGDKSWTVPGRVWIEPTHP
jgi:hypothetical protein